MSRARKHDYKGIAALGRGEDTMLVHMTPREVQSLQGIASAHGGSLTINPETGYPEAGWLSSILPIIATGVLGMTGVGAGLSAALVGGISAGATKIDGGSWMDALKAGAIGGVGSYAASGLTGGLADAAKPVALTGTEAANAAAAVAPSGAAGLASGTGAAQIASGTGAAQIANASPFVAPSISNMAQGAANVGKLGATASDLGAAFPMGAATSPMLGVPGAANVTSNTVADIGRNATGLKDWYTNLGERTSKNLGDMKEGVKNLWNDPNFDRYPGGGSKLLQHSVGTLSPVLTAGLSGELSGSKKDKSPKYKSPYEPYPGPYTMQRPSGGPTEEELAQYYASNNTGDINYFPGQNTFTSPNGPTFTHYAEGGIASLPGPQESAPGAVEGMLSGPGDGMSDSIPANIDGKQEARLADGEFVLPADVVSHIGNGSSKSGSQRLYAMMDAIRQARTGNPDQGKQINPDKFLPA